MYLLESLGKAILTNTQNIFFFLKNNMEISMKNIQSADFCADQIDIITNSAIIMNVVIKRVHCICELQKFRLCM